MIDTSSTFHGDVTFVFILFVKATQYLRYLLGERRINSGDYIDYRLSSRSVFQCKIKLRKHQTAFK